MNADTYRTLAVVFLALAVILAAVAVVLFRTLDIRAVHDALTGKRAEREIAELRGVRAGSWVNAEDLGERGRKGKHRGVTAQSDTTDGSRDTSDIEFRPITASGSSGASSGSASTKGGVTRGGHAKDEDADTRMGTKAAAESVVEIPVSMASAAELADEGETSLMQFRKPTAAPADDDESRTILVRGGKKN